METLVYIFFFCICMYFAFRLGWVAREVHAKKVLEQITTQALENVEELQKEVDNNLIRVKIERYNDHFFVYNMEDHSFMAQGLDRKELEKNLADRYPGKKFAAKEENLVEMGFLHNESV